MWIMITRKIPVAPEVSPPKLSIFWAVPWIHEEYVKKQLLICRNCGNPLLGRRGFRRGQLKRDANVEINKAVNKAVLGLYEDLEELFSYNGCCDSPKAMRPTDTIHYPAHGGSEPNWLGAVKIRYKGEDIRVFPHEYSIVAPENLSYYLSGDQDTTPWELVISDTPGQNQATISDIIAEGILQDVKEAAMLDGATEEMAALVSLGAEIDVEQTLSNIPVVGWYRCVDKNIISQFCYKKDIIEYD